MIQQADLGQSVGSFNAGSCEFATSLLDAGEQSIEYSISKITNSADCTDGVIRLDLINDRVLKYAYRGSGASTDGMLRRYAG